MRTCKHLLSACAAAWLLLAGPTGCQNYEIPAADPGLSYPAGEIAPSEGSYTSDTPSLRCSGTPEFAISSVTRNGEAIDSSVAHIDPATGVILLTPPSDAPAAGTYLVSVRVSFGHTTKEYKDALRVVVKGLIFEESEVVATRGARLVVPIRETCLVEQEGTVYSLALPEEADWNGISIDPATGTVTVEADADAGVYPISIRATNRTNPEGMLFAEVLTITVESKPYGLTYTPASVTLIPMEGHHSPRPTVHAASVADGTEVRYALLDDFGGTFAIDPATGEISLAENTSLVTQTAKSYPLQVRVSNDRGTTSFPEAYTITVDPAKKAEPITKIVYPGKFPVTLDPGQAWTSERPTVEGSTVGIVWSLAAGAPQGVAIDPATGVVALTQGHRMPLKTAENSLTVEVRNQGMTEPCTAQLEFSIDPILWQVVYSANASANATVNSGIANMDRYSFSGYIQNNQTETKKDTPTTIQVKNGFGKASTSSVNKLPCIDAIGLNITNTWSDNTNQNNDWLVSAEIEVPTGGFNPAIRFNYASQFGQDANNILELYIVEINGSNVYVKGEQNQDDKGMAATPSDLPWVLLATTAPDPADGVQPIEKNHCAESSNKLNLFELKPISADISSYKGKKIRFAFRYWNPDQNNNNSRTYRIESLRVEDGFDD